MDKNCPNLLTIFKTFLIFVGITNDSETQNQIVGGLKSVSMVSSKLLLAAKSVSVDPNGPNAKNLLAQAARLVHFNFLVAYYKQSDYR